MNNSKKNKHSLDKHDYQILKSIYTHRCLTVNQIHQLHFKVSSPIKRTEQRIQKLVKMNYLKAVPFKNEQIAYFLTTNGINAIRYEFDLPTNIYDAQRKVVRRGYYRASELEIYPKLINHQIHLNQFVIDFKKLNLNVNYKYFDEKYVSQYTGIRPDGMLSILDTDFFLEMDMGTESKKQLLEKWENYRNFLSSMEYSFREKRIVVLFIVEGTHHTQSRIDLVKYTIYERLLDVLDSEFEIYVGTSEDLLNLLKKRLVPSLTGVDPHGELLKRVLTEKHDFHVADGEHLKSAFNGTSFQYYIQKLNEQGNLLVENNRIQEFVVDDYFFEKCSVMSKIFYINKLNVFFKEKFQRTIPYLVVEKNELQLYKDCRMIELLDFSNVYFTTYQRLKELPFHEAVFQMDARGNIFHFSNSGLQERIFEQNLETLFN